MSHTTITARVYFDSSGAYRELPILVTEKGPVEVVMDYLIARSENRSLSWARKALQAIGLLMDYIDAHPGQFDKPEELMRAFASRLYTGTFDESGCDPSGLAWLPRRMTNVGTILNCLSDFSDWATETHGSPVLNPWRNPTIFDKSLIKIAYEHKRSRAFLGHTWKDALVHSQAKKIRSISIKRQRVVTYDGAAIAFLEKNFPRLILHGFVNHGKDNLANWSTRLNLRDCLITLLMHGGSLRLSECLHLWVDDVTIDPLYRDCAMVRIHHPEDGLSPDINGKSFKGNRAAFLMANYGLQPRTRLMGVQHLGWKDPALDGTKFMHVHWFPRYYGRLFLIIWIEYLKQIAPLERNHPYAFITLKENHNNQPYTQLSYNQAYNRAVERIGLVSGKKNGVSPHSHRHAYGRRVTKAGMDQISIKKMLHHKSLDSQQVYTTPSISQVNFDMELALRRLEGGSLPEKSYDQGLICTFEGFEEIDPEGLLSGRYPKEIYKGRSCG